MPMISSQKESAWPRSGHTIGTFMLPVGGQRRPTYVPRRFSYGSGSIPDGSFHYYITEVI